MDRIGFEWWLLTGQSMARIKLGWFVDPENLVDELVEEGYDKLWEAS